MNYDLSLNWNKMHEITTPFWIEEKNYCLTLYIRCEMNAPHNAHVDVFGWDPLILMISVGVPFVHLFVRLLSQIWQNTQICTLMWYQTIYFCEGKGIVRCKIQYFKLKWTFHSFENVLSRSNLNYLKSRHHEKNAFETFNVVLLSLCRKSQKEGSRRPK